MKAIRATSLIFGNLEIPVKIFPVSDPWTMPKEVEVHRECGTEVKRAFYCLDCNEHFSVQGASKVSVCPTCNNATNTYNTIPCPTCDLEVEQSTTTKGYKIGEKVVVLTKVEKKTLEKALPFDDAIVIHRSVSLDDVPSIHRDTTYFLLPDEARGGTYKYAAMLRALQGTAHGLFGEGLILKRFYPVLVTATARVMLLTTLHYADELWQPEPPRVALQDEHWLPLDHLILKSSMEFNPERHLRNPRRAVFEAAIRNHEMGGGTLPLFHAPTSQEVEELSQQVQSTLQEITDAEIAEAKAKKRRVRSSSRSRKPRKSSDNAA